MLVSEGALRLSSAIQSHCTHTHSLSFYFFPFYLLTLYFCVLISSGALRDETGGDTAAVDGAEDDDFSEDFKEQRGKRGAATDDDGAATDAAKSAKCRLGALGESAAAAATALDLDSNQLMAAYEQDWRLLQRCASIFSGWPAAQH